MDTFNRTPGDQGSAGPLVGIVIIILLLAAGGLYFFQTQRDMSGAELQQLQDPETAALKATGSSDTAASIEEDLEATDLGDFDAELNDLESQL